MTAANAERLASCERRYRDLARQLSEIGWIASGSLGLRADRCGKPNCACASDPARRHGPYWHLTSKVGGKTVNKRLREHEARLYQQWIANDRTVGAVLAEMRAIAAEAQAIILADQAPDATRRGPATPSPETRRTATPRHA